MVVIINYRTPGLTIDCLRSLEPEIARLPGATVIVGDNRSPDDSVERLRAAIQSHGWGAWASVMPLERNGGFAYGNNRVIESTFKSPNPPGLVWLLNPDTVVRPEGLISLVEFMQSRPSCAIAGSRMEDPDGTAQTGAFRFPSLFSEADSSVNLGLLSALLVRHRVWMDQVDQPTPVDWVTGASMMVRRAVFERVGLLDERFFMYFEEMDFCLQARKAGFQAWHVPASRIVHLVGQASGLTGPKTREKRRPAYWFRARRWFWVKNHGVAGAAAADVIRVLGTAICRAILFLRGRSNWMPPFYLRDLVRHSVFFGGTRP